MFLQHAFSLAAAERLPLAMDATTALHLLGGGAEPHAYAFRVPVTVEEKLVDGACVWCDV